MWSCPGSEVKTCISSCLYFAASSSLQPTALSAELGMAYYGASLARQCGETSLYKTKGDEKDQSEFHMSDWMKEKDFGTTGLCYPSKKFHTDLLKMEALFVDHHAGHEDGYNPGEDCVASLAEKINSEFPQYSQKLIQKLARSRTRVHVRALNRAIKSGHFESQRSLRKKIEHQF